MGFARDVVIVGGCGHVGLPLGLAFADRGLQVALSDLNAQAVEQVERGTALFAKAGAGDVLRREVGTHLVATTVTQIGNSLRDGQLLGDWS